MWCYMGGTCQYRFSSRNYSSSVMGAPRDHHEGLMKYIGVLARRLKMRPLQVVGATLSFWAAEQFERESR